MLFRNPKFANKKTKRGLLASDAPDVGHIWLDNRNKQIKATNNFYELLSNGDLLIRDLTFHEHYGQFACITRKGNRIDSVSTFIYPVSFL
jgi:hypothetical protein